MGYDVTLYLGNLWSTDSWREEITNSKGESMQSYEQVAEVDLCCVDNSLHKLMNEMPVSRYYIWQKSDDIENEPKVTNDGYNDFKMFTGNDVKKLYALIMAEQAKDMHEYQGSQGYRRYDMALGMLRNLMENFNNPIVIWYGS